MTTVYSPSDSWVTKVGNTGKPLKVQLRDSNGPINLTGSTIRFIMRPAGQTLASSNIVNAPAVLVAALTGEVKYLWVTADLDAAGDFWGEFEVTYPSGELVSWPTSKTKVPGGRYIKIEVQPSLV